MSAPVDVVASEASSFDVVHVFLIRSFRKLPVVDAEHWVAGQVSRRHVLSAIDSSHDNLRLFGVAECRSADDAAGDSAMRVARGCQRVKRSSAPVVRTRTASFEISRTISTPVPLSCISRAPSVVVTTMVPAGPPVSHSATGRRR